MSNIKAMIISVGGTIEPIVKSIAHHHPEYVCFFASQATNDKTVKAREMLGDLAGSIRFETVLADNENDLQECHEKSIDAVRRLLARQYGKDQVVVDYTGGTKNMSVALALAAIENGFCFSYVGGTLRNKNGVGIVETGHEVVSTHLNPWDFMAVKEKRQAALFFNSCQFKACRDILTDLAENAHLRKGMFRKLSLAADAFHNWDLFRHVAAQELFKKTKLDELAEDNEQWVAQFARNCLKLLPALDAIIISSDRGKKPSLELALDLYANAERRAIEGKIDDAILRLYRLVEMLAQQRLLDIHCINTSAVRAEQIPAALRDEYVKNYKDNRSNQIKLSQSATYNLLKALGDSLGMAFDAQAIRFKAVQQARNNSYLAHGFQSSKDQVYESLREFVVNLGALQTKKSPVFPKMEFGIV